MIKNIFFVCFLNISFIGGYSHLICSTITQEEKKECLDNISKQLGTLFQLVSMISTSTDIDIVTSLDAIDPAKLSKFLKEALEKFNHQFKAIKDTYELQISYKSTPADILQTNTITLMGQKIPIIYFLLYMIPIINRQENINMMKDNIYGGESIQLMLMHYFYNLYDYNKKNNDDLTQAIDKIYAIFDKHPEKDMIIYNFLSIITGKKVQESCLFKTISNDGRKISNSKGNALLKKINEKLSLKAKNLEDLHKYTTEKLDLLFMDDKFTQSVSIEDFLSGTILTECLDKLKDPMNDKSIEVNNEYCKIPNSFCWDNINRKVITDIEKIAEKYFYYHLSKYIEDKKTASNFTSVLSNQIKTNTINQHFAQVIKTIKNNTTIRKIVEYHTIFETLIQQNVPNITTIGDLDAYKGQVEQTKSQLEAKYLDIKTQADFVSFDAINITNINTIDKILASIDGQDKILKAQIPTPKPGDSTLPNPAPTPNDIPSQNPKPTINTQNNMNSSNPSSQSISPVTQQDESQDKSPVLNTDKNIVNTKETSKKTIKIVTVKNGLITVAVLIVGYTGRITMSKIIIKLTKSKQTNKTKKKDKNKDKNSVNRKKIIENNESIAEDEIMGKI